MIGSIDPDTGVKTFVLAQGQSDGLMTRDSRSFPGLTDTEQLMGFGLETPFLAGSDGSLEHAHELEVEGTDYIKTTSTGAITAETPLETDLSFDGGKLYVAQEGDTAQFRLKAIMTPVIGENLRIFVVAIDGYVVPATA